jgi:tetratricopeptide (TPR) repeat protein/glycosyltransferase involved in cell wall biosynthesis
MTHASELWAIAQQHYEARQFEDAIQVYRQVLTQLSLEGKPPDTTPTPPEVWHWLGMAYQQAGRVEDAVHAYQQAIALNPQEPRTFNNLGIALKTLGQYPAAIAAYRHAIHLKPDYADAFNNLGNLYRQQEDWEEAIAQYQTVLTLNPQHVDALHSLGAVYQYQEQYPEAIAQFRQALHLKPNHPDLHNSLGNALQRLKQFDAAIACYQRALELRPHDPAFHNNLAAALQELGRLDESIAYYQKALELRPNYPDAFYNLGNNFKTQDRLDEAVRCYKRAIALRPSYPAAYNNLGLTFYDQGKLRESIAAYRRALADRPDYPDAHLNMGLALLQSGDLRAGFAEYEWRWQVRGPNFKPARPFPQPQWEGSPFPGKTLLLHAEQGFGDTIQFIRYVPFVAQRGDRIVVECQPPLVRLLQSIPEIAQVIPRGEPLPEFDLHLPLMSLPQVFQTSLESVPNAVPYFPTPTPLSLPELDGHSEPDLRVGLVWAGSPGNQSDRHRSCALETFFPLLQTPQVRFYSLQKEVRAEDEPALQQAIAAGHLIDLRPYLNDFTDTAALIQQLDLVLTVDTSVAHLAGALGKPVWVMLTFAPDWRWLQHRETSPWYPTMRLFRQAAPFTWEEVLERVRLALQAGAIARGVPSTTYIADEAAANEWLHRGNELRRSGNIDQAIHAYQEAIAHNPLDFRAHNNLAVTLRQQQGADPLTHYRRAIAIHPRFADAHYNLGNALREDGNFDGAVYHYQQALAIQADNPDVWNNLGNTLKELGQLDQAVAAYERAIALAPDHASAHHNLGYSLLLLGNLRRGFAEYEWRWKVPGFKPPRPFEQPWWDGTPLHGKRILLYDEQGFGDAIQFSRYIPLVAQQGGQVILECREPLVALLERLPGVQQAIARGADLPDFDVHAPLMSLPHLLGTTLETIPAQIPYLTPPETSVELPATPGKRRVGIVWAGSPTHRNDRHRSCPFARFAGLMQEPDIQFYSLQLGARRTDLQALVDSALVVDLGDRLTDFAATAGAIAQLDLVITVDTSVAHLAGALGIPVWVLLPAAPDWRWMSDRPDSPWYPTMRLFRQPLPGDWDSVFEQIRAAFNQGRSPESTASEPTATPPAPLPEAPRKLVAIGWQLSPATGWGIYGTNLALHLLKNRQYAPVPLLSPMVSETTPFNPLHWALLKPLFEQQRTIAESLTQLGDRPLHGNFIVLKGLGNQFVTAPPLDRITGRVNVGVIFLENTHLSDVALAKARRYDRIVAGSRWNAEVLEGYGLRNVCYAPQGIDPTLFHPAPHARILGDRFVIFSGGKLEYRKGQDIVVRAFQQFHQRHPDAVLMTAWHNFWPQTMAGLETAGHVQSLPKVTSQGQLRIPEWLAEHGIPPEAVIDIGLIPNHLVAPIVREADVALFPNRGEGGTNLAAMECLACGVPTILSANTGHLDLIHSDHCYPLTHQTPVQPIAAYPGVEGWGESDVEEILAVLEQIYGDRPTAQQKGDRAAQFMQDWTWEKQVQRLLLLLP